MYQSGSVPQKYQHKVRIGNWSEEWELEKIRYYDYLNTKSHSSILQEKIQFAHQKASLGYSNNGYINFNDKIMLFNDRTGGYLSCDIWDKSQNIEEQYGVTTTQKTFPNIRSVFVIRHCADDQNVFGNQILHYGQKFKICVNPRMFKKPLYISSQQADPQKSKKNARQQDAYLSSKDNYDTVWTVEHVDPQIRYEMNKQPVQANDHIIIKHFQTNQYLASDNVEYKNTFGIENEVFVHQFQTFNKTQNLIAEKMGRTTIDIPMRDQHNQNVWVLVTADDPSLEFDENTENQLRNGKDVVLKIRKQLQSRGYYSIRGLGIMFYIIDEFNKGFVDYDNFRWGLRNFKVIPTQEELKMLYSHYDIQKNGLVQYQAFFQDLRGLVPEKRQQIIQRAFQKCQEQYKYVNLESLGQVYQAHMHPDVIKGHKSAKQHFDEFIKEWNIKELDQNIGLNDFMDYFSDVSAVIERNEHFEALMKDTFQL